MKIVWTNKISVCLLPRGKRGWKRMYRLEEADRWFCKKHQKWLTTPALFMWNGANLIVDRMSMSHARHDYVTGTDDHDGHWFWDDGTPISISQSADIYEQSMREEGYRRSARMGGRAVYLWWLLKGKPEVDDGA